MDGCGKKLERKLRPEEHEFSGNGTFFQNFKLKSLKKYLFLAVNFTDVIREHKLIEDAFFMPNREKIKKSPFIKEFKDELKRTLETHPILKTANVEYQNEADNRILTNSDIKIDFLKILKKERSEILKIFNGQIVDAIKLNKDDNENKTSESFDVVDSEPQLELIEKFGYDDKETKGLKFKTTNDRVISRTVRCGQKRIYVHCVSEYPLEDTEVKQINGKKWKKMPSKSLTKNNLQVTLFPSGEEEPNDKIKVIIRKISKEQLEPSINSSSPTPRSKGIRNQHRIDKYAAGKYNRNKINVSERQSIRSLNGGFIMEGDPSTIEMSDNLSINLIFKEFKIVKKPKKYEKPKLELQLPEMIPISSKDPYWKDYELDGEFIATPNDSEDKIIISIENRDFIHKFNSLDEGKKEKFKKDYLMQTYLTVLYYICQLKKENKDTSNFNENNTIKMLKSSQQAWLHSWRI